MIHRRDACEASGQSFLQANEIRSMRALIACLGLAVATLAGAKSATAAELVFVERKSCIYCVRFNREVAPDYSKSDLGRSVPLRHVDQRRWPSDLAAVDRPPYTPVFILVDKGREIGRFAGYTGARAFNRNLDKLLARAKR